MDQRLILITKYLLRINFCLAIYGIFLFLIVTLNQNLQILNLDENQEISKRLTIFTIWLITFPFIYYFAYKFTRNFIVKYPILNARENSRSFASWVWILNSAFDFALYQLFSFFRILPGIQGLLLFPIVIILVVCLVAERQKPNVFAHIIAMIILSLLFAGIFVAGMISN